MSSLASIVYRKPGDKCNNGASLRHKSWHWIHTLLTLCGLFCFNQHIDSINKMNTRTDTMASSRIFIQGIPPNMSAGELKKHFSKQGVVTDAKTFGNRRIGYIGYKTAEEATKALKYFNKSYFRMSKLSVEFAHPVSQSVQNQYPRIGS